MALAREKGLLIVYNAATKQCANFLHGLIGELASKGVAVNAIIYDEKAFAKLATENKPTTQRIVYIGDYPESNLTEKNISNWRFDQYGIRYGWHGSKAVIKFESLSQPEFINMVEFAEKELSKDQLDMRQNVGIRGINPLKRLKELSLIEKIGLGVGALVAPFIVSGIALVGAMGLMIKNKDKLDPVQMRDKQQKFAVLHFSLNHLSNFMGIKEDNE